MVYTKDEKDEAGVSEGSLGEVMDDEDEGEITNELEENEKAWE